MELFLNAYREIQSFLMEDSKKNFELDEYRQSYLTKMMDTTCLGGKYNRGVCVMDVAEAMANHLGLTESEKSAVLHDAAVCGWMIEFLQAHFLVEDDIMDHSKTRRGKPCWYLHPGVTTQAAINDGLILLAWATRLAHHYFGERPEVLAGILKSFHDVDLTTAMGQLYDVTSMVDSKKLDPDVPRSPSPDYVDFNFFNYRRIVVHKTAYYTYWLPLQMGLIVSGGLKLVDAKVLHSVAMLMGEYFQVQDDVMDCFTPPHILGKVGTDIEDAKCSWLAVTFLSAATNEQKKKFKENYGHTNEDKVAVVKDLFKEVKLQSKFEEYEQDVAGKVEALLKTLSEGCPAFGESVAKLWNKTYKRSK